MGSFHEAVRTGRAGFVIRLANGGEDVDEKDDCGFTPLHVASSKKEKEIALLLIKLGANVHMVTKNEWTALHISAQLGEKEIAAALLAKGANVEAADREGCVPLHICACHGMAEVANLLLDKGAQVEARDRLEWTPLHVAAEKGRTGIAQVLLNRGADVEATGKHSWRPLHLCAQENTVEVAKALFEKRVDVEAFEEGGRNPLHICAQFGSTEMAVALIKQGAGVNNMTAGGESALHLCARFGTTRTAVALMDNGAAIDVRDSNNDTALHAAVSGESEDLVSVLVSRDNAKLVNLVNSRGLTPLHLVVNHESASIVELLVRAGARHDIKDNYGKTPMDYVCSDHWLWKLVKVDQTTPKSLEKHPNEPVASSPQQKGNVTLTCQEHVDQEKFADGGGATIQTADSQLCGLPRYVPWQSAKKLRKHRARELPTVELIVGIDFTRSNTWNGRIAFGGRSLHAVDGPPNPYMMCLDMAAKTLELHDDAQIPCYGFGDTRTVGKSVFSFFNNGPARGMGTLLERYKQIVSSVHMSGPTSFAPLIRQAMKDVYESGMQFHILLILADGQVSEECWAETEKAIVEACAFPLSIVMIGVGDGPWDAMHEFDNGLPQRPWDNFHFYEFGQGSETVLSRPGVEEMFKLNALAELPEQYAVARYLTGSHNKVKVESIIKCPAKGPIDPPLRG